MDLLAFERKLDATIMRKRLDIQEALKRPQKIKRKLRIFISHTFFPGRAGEPIAYSSIHVDASKKLSLLMSVKSSLLILFCHFRSEAWVSPVVLLNRLTSFPIHSFIHNFPFPQRNRKRRTVTRNLPWRLGSCASKAACWTTPRYYLNDCCSEKTVVRLLNISAVNMVSIHS